MKINKISTQIWYNLCRIISFNIELLRQSVNHLIENQNFIIVYKKLINKLFKRRDSVLSST